jgi:hypothetical protein
MGKCENGKMKVSKIIEKWDNLKMRKGRNAKIKKSENLLTC